MAFVPPGSQNLVWCVFAVVVALAASIPADVNLPCDTSAEVILISTCNGRVTLDCPAGSNASMKSLLLRPQSDTGSPQPTACNVSVVFLSSFRALEIDPTDVSHSADGVINITLHFSGSYDISASRVATVATQVKNTLIKSLVVLWNITSPAPLQVATDDGLFHIRCCVGIQSLVAFRLLPNRSITMLRNFKRMMTFDTAAMEHAKVELELMKGSTLLLDRSATTDPTEVVAILRIVNDIASFALTIGNNATVRMGLPGQELLPSTTVLVGIASSIHNDSSAANFTLDRPNVRSVTVDVRNLSSLHLFGNSILINVESSARHFLFESLSVALWGYVLLEERSTFVVARGGFFRSATGETVDTSMSIGSITFTIRSALALRSASTMMIIGLLTDVSQALLPLTLVKVLVGFDIAVLGGTVDINTICCFLRYVLVSGDLYSLSIELDKQAVLSVAQISSYLASIGDNVFLRIGSAVIECKRNSSLLMSGYSPLIQLPSPSLSNSLLANVTMVVEDSNVQLDLASSLVACTGSCSFEKVKVSLFNSVLTALRMSRVFFVTVRALNVDGFAFFVNASYVVMQTNSSLLWCDTCDRVSNLSVQATGLSSIVCNDFGTIVKARSNAPALRGFLLVVAGTSIALSRNSHVFSLAFASLKNLTVVVGGASRISATDVSAIMTFSSEALLLGFNSVVKERSSVLLNSTGGWVYCNGQCKFDQSNHSFLNSTILIDGTSGWFSSVGTQTKALNISIIIANGAVLTMSAFSFLVSSFQILGATVDLSDAGTSMRLFHGGMFCSFGGTVDDVVVSAHSSAALAFGADSTMFASLGFGAMGTIDVTCNACLFDFSSAPWTVQGTWLLLSGIRMRLPSGEPKAAVLRVVNARWSGSTGSSQYMLILPSIATLASSPEVMLDSCEGSGITHNTFLLQGGSRPKVVGPGGRPCWTSSTTATASLHFEAFAARRAGAQGKTTNVYSFVSGGIAASLGGPAAASTAVRGALALRLLSCESVSTEDSFDGNYLQLGFGGRRGYFIRGAVAGCLIILLVAMALCCLAVLFTMIAVREQRVTAVHKQVFSHDSLFGGEAGSMWSRQLALHSVATLSLPGWLVVPYALVLQPLVGGSVALLIAPGEDRSGADVALALFGIGLVVAAEFLLVMLVTRWFAAKVSVDAVSSVRSLRQSKAMAGVRWLTRRVGASSGEWRDDTSSSRGKKYYGRFVRCFGALFEVYRGGRQWFVIVESLVSVTAGVLQATALHDPTSCAHSLVALAVVQCAIFAVVVFMRPHAIFIEYVTALVLGFIGALYGVMALVPHCDTCTSLASVLAELQVYASFLQIVASLLAAFGVVLNGKGHNSLLHRVMHRLVVCIRCDPISTTRDDIQGVLHMSMVEAAKAEVSGLVDKGRRSAEGTPATTAGCTPVITRRGTPAAASVVTTRAASPSHTRPPTPTKSRTPSTYPPSLKSPNVPGNDLALGNISFSAVTLIAHCFSAVPSQRLRLLIDEICEQRKEQRSGMT